MPDSSSARGEGGDEDVAMLMAQHGAARYADLATIEICLDRDPTPAPPLGKSTPDGVRGTLEPSERSRVPLTRER